MGFLFDAFNWLTIVFTVVAETLCIAAALYIACDVAEDCPSQARRLLKWSLLSVAALYLILALDSDVPASRCLIGAACHLALLPLLRTFPIVDLTSAPSVLALLATIGNHALWFQHFLSVDRYDYGYGGSSRGRGAPSSPLATAGFFLLLVWAVPVGFFVCMTSSDECLPVAGGGGGKKKKRGMFKRIVDAVLQRTDESASGYAPGMGKYY